MNFRISNLSVYLRKKQIVKNINLEIKSGKLHVLMGPNGSGKTTLVQALMGNPNYQIKDSFLPTYTAKHSQENSKITINNKDITNLNVEKRARLGLFLAFQNPIAIPGVNIADLLRMSYQTIKKRYQGQKKQALCNPFLSVAKFNEMIVKKAKKLDIPSEFLRRSLNEEFSGGEKKKLEMLQALVIEPRFAIFDEIDTGLDVDALKIIAKAINELKRQGVGILLITHYQRILRFIKPDFIHILVDGKIVESGDFRLAIEIEDKGYSKWVDR